MDPVSHTDDPRAPAARPPSGVFDELANGFAFAREALSQFLELVSLEGRRAGLSLVWMFAGGLVAAIFIVTAWTALMAAAVMYVVPLGLHPAAAAIVVAALNLIAGAVVLYRCIGLSRHLLFTASRRQLASGSLVRSPTP